MFDYQAGEKYKLTLIMVGLAGIMAICQAIDLLEPDERERLSSKTRAVYTQIRSKADFIKEDIVPFESIAEVCKLIKETPFNI